MSDNAWSHTRIYKMTVKAFYDTYIHPVRCSRYQRHQQGIDDVWLEAETDRLERVKLARDKAYASVLFWEEAKRTASSPTYRITVQSELDRCTKQHIDAMKVCNSINAEIGRVHARRNRFGTKPQRTAVPVRQLVVQPAA